MPKQERFELHKMRSRAKSIAATNLLRDPNTKGYLVYALATSDNSTDVLFGGHFRVTISANGEKVQKVDALSLGSNVVKKTDPSRRGGTASALWLIWLVSKKPLETHVYLNLLHGLPVYAGSCYLEGVKWPN